MLKWLDTPNAQPQMLQEHGASNAEIARLGCGVLWYLSVNANNSERNVDNQNLIVDAGGIDLIVRMMEMHGESNAGVAAEGCGVLWILADTNANNKRKILAANGVSMIERMKSTWLSNSGVQTYANKALGSLC